MNAPILWVVLPGVAGLVFWFLRKRSGLVILLSVILCLLLAVLAWLLPVGETFRIGPLSFLVDPNLDFAGRSLVLSNTDRPFLIFVFFVCAFWFAGSFPANANNLLIPFGLGIVALLLAAIAVEPFLYAALLIEMAVLLAVPVLAPPGKPFSQGVLRFLIFQTLAMPFILLAGWALAGVETDPANLVLVTLSTVLLGLGFAFWLAVFPFYTWVPLLAGQSHPYSSGFVFLIFPTTNLLLGLSFLDRFGWLRASPGVFQAIGQIGALMIVTAGVWAVFQKSLDRLLGYGVIVETGFSLLAVGLASQVGLQLFSSMFLPRMIGLGLWALSLAILLRETHSMRFEDIYGLSEKMPYASAGLAVASLSLAGLPLLGVFPIRLVLLEELSGQSLISAFLALAGSVGMLFSSFRALAVLAGGQSLQRGALLPRTFRESRLQIALLLGGMACLLLIGLFPQAFLPLFDSLLRGYVLLP